VCTDSTAHGGTGTSGKTRRSRARARLGAKTVCSVNGCLVVLGEKVVPGAMAALLALLPAVAAAAFHTAHPHRADASRQQCHRTDLQLCAPSPSDWREFRQRLVSGGIQVTGEDGGKERTAESPASTKARIAVAPQNEELLKQQNEALWTEYLEGAWAHESGSIEVGGLICRLPLPSQLMRQMRAGDSSYWPGKLRAILLAELPAEEAAAISDGKGTPRLLEQWSSNTMYMHRLAESLVTDGLQEVASKASGGRIQWDAVRVEQRELLKLYRDAQDSWQEVALVLRADEGVASGAEGSSVASEAVVINRPIARSMSRQLAELLLNGADEARDGPPQYDDAFVQRFLSAFAREAAVYVGGPDLQEAAGLCVHGSELPGAVEVAPGTRIFTGGVPAVVEAVLEGQLSPLDVRWFVGRRLSVSCAGSQWCPIACSRPLALKQCLGLPKPLWHEVLETAGGELADISRIEYLKRADLQQE